MTDMTYRLDITARLHRQMLDVVGTALPLITSSRADADLSGLAHLRQEMVRTLEAYSVHVKSLGDAALIARCASLEQAYQSFRARWVYRDGIEHWYEYRLSAIVMMKQVRALVQQAEAERTTAPRVAATA